MDMNAQSENYKDQLNEAQDLIQQHDEDNNLNNQLSKLSKEEIIVKAESLIQTADVKSAYEHLLILKDVYEKRVSEERPAQIQQWVNQGNDAKDFVPPADELKIKLHEIFNRFHKLREEEKKRAEEEKLVNLNKKRAILSSIKDLVDADETDNTLSDLRDLMRQWKEIRTVPREFQDELASEYKILIETYYDNLSIYNELKDLDREKNLEIKIELIKKVEELKDEENMRKALVSLNKCHDDWKNTGPVRKEISEEIWQRFKASSDIIIEKVKAQRAEMDAKRKENLEKKVLLIEKSETAIAVMPENIKGWQSLAKELDGYFEEWKKIGPVPQESNQETWARFQGARTAFYNARKSFFKELNKNRESNLEKKLALCEKAESMKDSDDFMKTSDAYKALQEEWKKIGPVPEEHNQPIWTRFRAAFDHFFERRNAFFTERREQESGAVEKRKEIIDALVKITESGEKISFEQLKEIQNSWNKSGFVSGKRFHTLNNKYQKLIDPLFQQIRDSSKADRVKHVKEFVENLSESPDGKAKIKKEERRLKDIIKKIDEEISTIENNKNFFQYSKNADSVMKQFDEKIQKLNNQKDKLLAELKVYKQNG